MNNNQTETIQTKCCEESCTKTFEAGVQQLTNTYKCDQPQFSSPELWNIEKRRKQFTRRSSIFAIN
jgi:hypothetical protein